MNRQRFSRDCIKNFLQIERPNEAPAGNRSLCTAAAAGPRLGVAPTAPDYQFFSIGEFYQSYLPRDSTGCTETLGDALFSGDPARQITSEYFFSGGGHVIPVTDIASARRALDLIAGQGEGFGGGIYDAEHELSHYYRFQQLTLGRFYQAGDKPNAPTGPPVNVDWDASFPVKSNATLADFPAGPSSAARPRPSTSPTPASSRCSPAPTPASRRCCSTPSPTCSGFAT